MKVVSRRRTLETPTRRMGIDLGGTKIEGIVLDEEHNEIFRTRIPTEREHGYEHIIEQVAAITTVLREYAPDCKRLGIGTPGAISRRTGMLKNSNTTCLNGRMLLDDLEERLRFPVRIENDANCFAFAEAHLGNARAQRLAFGVILGTGVGGGLVFRGELWSGPQHIAGEWGHHAIDPNGPECYCGQRGCVETLLSGPGLQAAYRERTGGVETDPPEIVARALAGEHYACDVLDQYIEHFGRAMANVITILDPDVIVLGGGMSNVAALYDRGVEAVARHVFNDELTTPIRKNALGDSAGVIGAALLGA
jgi:fructokinase